VRARLTQQGQRPVGVAPGEQVGVRDHRPDVPAVEREQAQPAVARAGRHRGQQLMRLRQPRRDADRAGDVVGGVVEVDFGARACRAPIEFSERDPGQ